MTCAREVGAPAPAPGPIGGVGVEVEVDTGGCFEAKAEAETEALGAGEMRYWVVMWACAVGISELGLGLVVEER